MTLMVALVIAHNLHAFMRDQKASALADETLTLWLISNHTCTCAASLCGIVGTGFLFQDIARCELR